MPTVGKIIITAIIFVFVLGFVNLMKHVAANDQKWQKLLDDAVSACESERGKLLDIESRDGHAVGDTWSVCVREEDQKLLFTNKIPE